MLHLKYDQPKTLLKRIDEGGHKTCIKLYIYHPINLHGVDFRFINLRVKQCHIVMHCL